jgi:hypothetical protein
LADDKSEHVQPDASQHSFDEAWWSDYQAQVNKSVIAAEQYLEVPVGTISSIPDDPDFIATVKMYAVIEPILNDLIASWQQPPPQTNPYQALFLQSLGQNARDNFRAFVTALNIRGPTGKLKLAKGLGLLAQDRIAFIRAVARVRNRYAHNVKNMHRSLADIVTEEQRSNARIIEHLTGITLPLAPADRVLLKPLMYHRLAAYLSDALHTLRPPPPPEGGMPWTSLASLHARILNKPK